jgi:hypothetical protein
MAYITELMQYVGSDAHIHLELLGNNQVKLHISAEFLNYAQKNGVEAFLDFGWMKNAFIVDFLAEALIEKGYTLGYLVSYDGFGRYLEGKTTEYTLPLYDRFENIVDRPGTYSVKGPVNTVTFRNYPLAEGDVWHYYSFGSTGTIASVYTDPTDGICKSATDNLICYSKSASCAEMVLSCAPLFLTEELDEKALLSLAKAGVQSIWAEGKELRYTDSTDLLRYNGIYWQESRQMAVGAMMEFLDRHLQDAKDQLAAAKQALIDSGVPQEDIMAGGKTLSKAASGADQIILLLAYLSAQQ